MNAVNLEISQELTQIWKDFDKDDESRAAGLTGKGREELWHQRPWLSAAASDRRIDPPANVGGMNLSWVPNWAYMHG
ncbi:MAG: hypothetical protein A3H27_04175 [Acidobacteria bacterium RIFCSPLOWO2_02_FULL_59_13]|nr:MAG: hypothetical protein A3H27_04175 [Acidobacteria bacterium RIFCSPLOWO2_02_FULL_59_13]